MRIAFAGFRHGHILSAYKLARRHPDVEIVAACEDHGPTRASLKGVDLTHGDYRRMLEDVDCDAVAVGDYYARRGAILIAALEAGRHVIADKPICTRLQELEQIAALASEKHLSVGCQLDLRDSGVVRAGRRVLAEGAIGEVHTVLFTGQHPLRYGTRPGWYFEPGKHGGTINDIAIHAIDAIPWMTGRRFAEAVAARAWNARLAEVPFFQDGAQLLLRLDNDGGAVGDVSYRAPDAAGYALPQFWRFTFHGSDGLLEFGVGQKALQLIGAGEKKPRTIEPDAPTPGGYFESFLREIAGAEGEVSPTTQEVLAAARTTLTIQQAADEGTCNVALQ